MSDDEDAWISHSNIGLCHGLLGDHTAANGHHQEALKAALQVQVEPMNLERPVRANLRRSEEKTQIFFVIPAVF